MTDLSTNSRHFGSNEAFSGPSSSLPGVVTAEILPQLMRSHGISAKGAARSLETGITEDDISQFCEIVNAGDQRSMSQTIASLRTRGIGHDSLLIDLLPQVAQELGRRWTTDESDFASVTIALGHLQQLRREIGHLPGPGLMPAGPAKRACLAPTPGEQHNFGLMIVDHFLHQAGWDVTTLPESNAEDLTRRLARESFEIAGLSISCEAYLLPLEKLVATIRRTSRNKNIGILVGGRLFLEKPDLAVLIGADATAHDGRDAVLQAERLAAGNSCLLLTE